MRREDRGVGGEVLKREKFFLQKNLEIIKFLLTFALPN
jgi:hypothetical protein